MIKSINIRPLVSVIVPCYNHEKYIQQCIESILNQSYSNIELIVVDDGSTDKSREILLELKEKNDFILIFQENKGVSATLRNILSNIATGELFSFCASDDYFHPLKIEKQVDFLLNHIEYKACYTKAYHIDINSNVINAAYLRIEEKKYKSGYIFNDLFLLNYTLPVTFMYRKELYEELDFYKSDVYCEDYYSSLLIASKYSIGFLDDYLYYYRVHENDSKKSKKIIDSQKDIIDLYKKHPLYKKAVNNWKLRKIDTLSRYSSFKFETFLSLISYFPISDKRYWKSWLRFFLFWEK